MVLEACRKVKLDREKNKQIKVLGVVKVIPRMPLE